MLPVLALLLAPALVGGVATPARAETEAVRIGPPAVCHPFAIGEARSLPWKAGAFGYDPDFPLDKLNPELAVLLDHQEDSLVQLESIRRAVIYAVGFGRIEELDLSERRLHTERLVSMLRARVLVDHLHEGKPDPEARSRAWFHLGYALAAIDQLDWDHVLGNHLGKGEKELAQAMRWEGVDAGMCLGAGLAMWSTSSQADVDAMLLRAARLAGPDGGLVTRNLLDCGARFYDQDDYDSLVRHLQKRIAAS